MMRYKTACLQVFTECCNRSVYLVRRGSSDKTITWRGVPCSNCGKTYTYELEGFTEGAAAFDFRGWLRCPDVHPELESMHCWALGLEEDEPLLQGLLQAEAKRRGWDNSPSNDG